MEDFSELLPLMVASGHPPDGFCISERITHARALGQRPGKLYGKIPCMVVFSAEQNITGLLSYLRWRTENRQTNQVKVI